MTKQREYNWFIEPRGNVAHTNEVISNNVDSENAMSGVLCADGKKHNLWRCPSGLILFLWRSRVGLKISFKVFCQSGKNGKIRDVTLLYKNDRGSPKRNRRKKKAKEHARALKA